MRMTITGSKFVFVSLLAVMILPFQATGVPNTTEVKTLCNGNTFSKDDPFKKSVDYVVEDLIEQTPSNKCDYTNISPFPISFAYGHGTCNATLSAADSHDCLSTANQKLRQSCGDYAVGARITLIDCSIRYEAYPFSD